MCVRARGCNSLRCTQKPNLEDPTNTDAHTDTAKKQNQSPHTGGRLSSGRSGLLLHCLTLPTWPAAGSDLCEFSPSYLRWTVFLCFAPRALLLCLDAVLARGTALAFRGEREGGDGGKVGRHAKKKNKKQNWIFQQRNVERRKWQDGRGQVGGCCCCLALIVQGQTETLLR